MLCHLALISLNHRLWEVIFNIENKGLEPEEKRKLTHQLGKSREFKVYKMSGQWTVEEEIYIHDQQICDKCQASLAISKFKLQWEWEGFPGGPVVKNSLCNARDLGLIHGRGTKVQHVAEQLSLCIATRKSTGHNERSHTTRWKCHVPHLRPNTVKLISKYSFTKRMV